MKMWMQFNVMPWTSLGVEKRFDTDISTYMKNVDVDILNKYKLYVNNKNFSENKWNGCKNIHLFVT